MRRVEETLLENHQVAPVTNLNLTSRSALKPETLQMDRGGIDRVDPGNRGMLAKQRGLAQQGGLKAR